jgi:hypothetical protein
MDVPKRRSLVGSLWRILLGTGCGLGLLTAMVWPGECRTCRNRGRASEAAAIATLSNIHTAQHRLRTTATVDRDEDGHGEFGGFGALTAAAPHPCGPPAPPLLAEAFAELHQGRAARNGYLFQIWLPARGGGWIPADGPGDVDAEAARRSFRCFAWPGIPQAKRAFCVDETGQVQACDNQDRRYVGTSRPLTAAAAAPPQAMAAVVTGARGPGDWYPVP